MKILFLLILPTFIYGQNISNSIGIVSLNETNYSEKNDKIQILNQDGSIWYEFSFYYDDSDGKWDYPNDDLNILAFHPDYFLFKIRCNSKSGEKFEVTVNEMFEETKFMKNSPNLSFQTWSEYVLSSFAVDFDSVANPILDKIDGTALRVESLKEDSFKPTEIDRNWLKVSWVTDSGNNFGWIRWRDENSLLVEPAQLD